MRGEIEAQIGSWLKRLVAKSKSYWENSPNAKRTLSALESLKLSVEYGMGRRAGQIRYSAGLIRINGHAKPEHAEKTLAHELAHFFSYYVDGYNGHGFFFKQWMIRLGYTPTTTHDYSEIMEHARGDWYFCARCRREFKSTANLLDREHRRCGGRVKAGRAPGPSPTYVEPLVTQVPVAAAALSARPDATVDGEVKRLLGMLSIISAAGESNSPEGRKTRRELRKLGHRGGLR